MTQTVIDYYYEKAQFGDNVYVEKKQYVENHRQFLQSTVVELDPNELEENYHHIIDTTNGEARWNFRPVKIYNEFSSTVVEHTSEDDFEEYGDHRNLTNNTAFDDYLYNHKELIFNTYADELFTDAWMETLQATSGKIDIEECNGGREKWIKDNESMIRDYIAS